MLRFLDIFFSFFGMLFLSPLLIFIYVISLTEGNDPLFVQERLGKEKRPFKLIKFRTMKPNTESIASHLISKDQITTFGKFLRSSKIDELPQLWNVFKGEMSFVGPRPNLSNQLELIKQRDMHKVYRSLPGITGLAQIKKIDMSKPKLLAITDSEMLQTLNLKNYFFYIIKTIFGSGSGDAVER